MAGPRRRSWLIGAGVAVLAIVALVLSVLALTQYRTPTDAGNTPGPSVTLPAPVLTDQPPETQAPPEPITVVAPTRLIAAQDAGRVYRATVGACPEPRTAFEFSNDGGATWQAGNATGSTDSTMALTLSIGGPEFVQMVTLAAAGCAPQYIRSFVSGIDWEVFNNDLGAAWFLNPGTPGVVHSPQGDLPTPCTAVALSGTGDRAAVLCDDSTVATTTDAAATWAAPVPVPGAAAIAVSPNGYRVAVLNAEGCLGGQDLEVADGVLTPPGGSLSATAAPGEVAITTAADDSVYVWAGDTVARSADGGAGW
jgi:hypothetical protein